MFEIAFTFMCWNTTHWEKINCGEVHNGKHIDYVCEKPVHFEHVGVKSVCVVETDG